MLTRKDLKNLNLQFSNGQVHNESSLDFVLTQTARSPHWYKTMCLLTRAILLDHIFEDGNKRTAAAVIMSYLEVQGYSYHADKISQLVLTITQKNIINISLIGRLIRNVIE